MGGACWTGLGGFCNWGGGARDGVSGSGVGAQVAGVALDKGGSAQEHPSVAWGITAHLLLLLLLTFVLLLLLPCVDCCRVLPSHPLLSNPLPNTHRSV